MTKYSEFLHADCGHPFAVWLGIDVPKRDYSGGLVCFKSSKATGDYCKTLKAAKASYKAALKAKKGER